MVDILEGVVVDVVDGNQLELEIQHVEAENAGLYGAREVVRLDRDGTLRDEEAVAHLELDYENRRVRCYVDSRDSDGCLLCDVEVLSPGAPSPGYGLDGDGE